MLSERVSSHGPAGRARTAAAAHDRDTPGTRSELRAEPAARRRAPRPGPSSARPRAAPRRRSARRTAPASRPRRVARRRPSGTTAIAFVSIGTGASRWCTTRARTTTSAPASASSSHGSSNVWAMLDPWPGTAPGHRPRTPPPRRSPARAGRPPATTTSAASCPCASESASTTATGSPTYRTVSRASTSRANGPSNVPLAPSTLPLGACGEIRRSSAVNTAATPGIDRASSNPSMPLTRPCGMMERTNTARSASGIGTFSTYRPSPRRNRGSSVRRAGRRRSREAAHGPMLATNRTHEGGTRCDETGRSSTCASSSRSRARPSPRSAERRARRRRIARVAWSEACTDPPASPSERTGASSTWRGDRADPDLRPEDQGEQPLLHGARRQR